MSALRLISVIGAALSLVLKRSFRLSCIQRLLRVAFCLSATDRTSWKSCRSIGRRTSTPSTFHENGVKKCADRGSCQQQAVGSPPSKCCKKSHFGDTEVLRLVGHDEIKRRQLTGGQLVGQTGEDARWSLLSSLLAIIATAPCFTQISYGQRQQRPISYGCVKASR
jgi:hypothetical protein